MCIFTDCAAGTTHSLGARISEGCNAPRNMMDTRCWGQEEVINDLELLIQMGRTVMRSNIDAKRSRRSCRVQRHGLCSKSG